MGTCHSAREANVSAICTCDSARETCFSAISTCDSANSSSNSAASNAAATCSANCSVTPTICYSAKWNSICTLVKWNVDACDDSAKYSATTSSASLSSRCC